MFVLIYVKYHTQTQHTHECLKIYGMYTCMHACTYVGTWEG